MRREGGEGKEGMRSLLLLSYLAVIKVKGGRKGGGMEGERKREEEGEGKKLEEGEGKYIDGKGGRKEEG